MCGISGIVLNEPAQPEIPPTLLDRMRHRGPDGDGCYLAPHVALVHTRLSIIDLEGGTQPLYSPDRNLVLIANGEIYNHIELRQALESAGHRFQTRSDSEVILHAYAAYGESCLERLHGMFAFALLDRKAGTLLLARDRLGIKPLYLAQTGNGIAFASELKALLPWLAQCPAVDPAALGLWLQGHTVGVSTLLNGVETLPPGTALRVDLHGHGRHTQQWQYWRLVPRNDVPGNQQEALERFDELMREVLAAHLRADVPYGLFLSGGVDSSLLLALVHSLTGARLRTFALEFKEESGAQEVEIAPALARRFNAKHTQFQVSMNDLIARLADTVWAGDAPVNDQANLPTALLADHAATELRVMLTGEGADEAFAGYAHYRHRPIQHLLRSLRRPGLGDLRYRGQFTSAQIAALAAPAVASAARRFREPLQTAWQDAPAHWSRLQRKQAMDIAGPLTRRLLPKVDLMLMSASVEGRVPYLDHRVVEFGFSLPDRWKVDGRKRKVFLKQWGERYVDADMLWRKKRGFRVPVDRLFTEPFLSRVADVLMRNPAITSYFCTAGIRALVERQRHRANAADQLYSLLVFALWHHLLLDSDGSRPPRSIDPLSVLG